MNIAIASDHAGFEEKQSLKAYLIQKGYQVIDLGPDSDDRVDYPDYAKKLSDIIVEDKAEFGILVCGTGIGMAIAANKIDGIRAANVTSVQFATLAREHNDANVVTLSGRFVSDQENKDIVDAFLNTAFAGGRHAGRVEKIMALQ